MQLQMQQFSKFYHVAPIEEKNIQAVYHICKGNPLYYEHYPKEVTMESLREDMYVLPPGKMLDSKYYVGFFDKGDLIAILDVITGYPTSGTAYIGFFMLAIEKQSKCIGSSIIQELLAYLIKEGFQDVQLGYMQGNLQSEHFWLKQGFVKIGGKVTEMGTIVKMRKYIF